MRWIVLDLLILLTSVPAGFAQSFSTLSNHVESNGHPDRGTTTPGPNGDSITTYSDGWVRVTELDNSFGPGGTTVTEKDAQGRIRHIANYDAQKRQRHFTDAEEAPDGSTELTYFNYDENGTLVDIRAVWLSGRAEASGATENATQDSIDAPGKADSDEFGLGSGVAGPPGTSGRP